jgi:hypothetical protein
MSTPAPKAPARRGRPPTRTRSATASARPRSVSYARSASYAPSVYRRSRATRPKAAAQDQPRARRQTTGKILTGKEMSKEEAISYFDPAKNTSKCINIPNSLGSFLTLNSLQRLNISTSTLGGVAGDMYFIFAHTNSNLVCLRFATTGSSARQLVPIIATDWTTVPESMRASRASIAINNSSNNNVADGSVSMLSIPNGLQWQFEIYNVAELYPQVTNAFVSSLQVMTDSHPKSAHYSHNEIRTLRTVCAAPSSFVGISNWREFEDYTQGTPPGSAALTLNQHNFMVGLLDDSTAHQALNTIIVRIKYTATTNIYDLIFRVQHACRFPSNNLLSRMEFDHGPPLTADKFNKVASKASEVVAGS